jgi:hypothetical protein
MAKIGGGVFATPYDPVLLPTLTRMMQQIEVSAAHQFQAAAAETDGPVAQIVGLPSRLGRYARFAEQTLCDDAIRVAGKASIERPEDKLEPLTLLRRQTIRWPATEPASCDAPQTERRICACREIAVERDHDGGWRRGAGAADEDDRHTVMPVIDEPMLTVGGVARECGRQGIDRARIRECLRRRGDENRGGIEMRQPDYRRVISLKIRIDREIAAPIARPPSRKSRPDRQSRRWPSDSRADNWDCGAGTPMQVPSD